MQTEELSYEPLFEKPSKAERLKKSIAARQRRKFVKEIKKMKMRKIEKEKDLHH